ERAGADGLGGGLDDAERGLTASIAGWRAAGERGWAVSVCDYLGQVHLARGRLDAALGTYQLALEIAAGPGQLALPAAGIAYTGIAEVEYQRGELDAPLRPVTPGLARLPAAPPGQPPRAEGHRPGQAVTNPAGHRRSRRRPGGNRRGRAGRAQPGREWPGQSRAGAAGAANAGPGQHRRGWPVGSAARA